MGSTRPRIYLSSSFEDLKLHRRAARDQLEKLGFDVFAMEAYSAEEGRSLDRCLQDVRTSDLYVGLFAWRYGSIAPGHAQSFAELEYREAGQHHVERLVFLLDPATPWPPNQMDSHLTGDDRAIRRLRDELEQAHLCAYFTTPESLASELSAAVKIFLERRAAGARAIARGETPSDLAIDDYVHSVLAELSPSFDLHYVSLRATIEGHELAPAADAPRGLRPPSFEVIDRHLSGSPPAAEQLEAAELALDRFTQFVALGEPGAGKTMFLHSLELKTCRRLRSEPEAPVPLFIRLTQWPESVSDLGTLIVHERTVRALQSVPTRRLLLLLDELNELDEDLYELRLGAIAKWALANPSVPIVIASRRQRYESGPKLSMPTVVLRPLDDSRVESFIRGYLGERADALLSDLIWEPKGAVAARRLSHLARNPYLLRLLCYVYERTGQAPPPSRGRLLQLLVESLWDRERRKGSTGELSFQSLLRRCSELAIAMIRRGASTSVHLDFAVKHLPAQPSADRILQLMQDASLVHTTKNGRFVQFTHQMLLEYFGAEYLRANPTKIEEVIPSPQFSGGVRVSRPIDEVLSILLDLAEPAKVLVPVVQKDPFLAAELAGTITENTEVKAKFLRQLVDVLADALDADADREASVQALSRLGASGVDALRPLLKHEHKWVRRSAVQALARIGSPNAVEAMVQALGDSDRWVRREAGAGLAGLADEARAPLEEYLLDGLRRLPSKTRKAIGRELLVIFDPVETRMRELTMEVCEIRDESPPSKPTETVPQPPLPRYVQGESSSITDMNWFRAHWTHEYFSANLEAFLRTSTPGRREREELLRLMALRWRTVGPGLHHPSTRNHIVLRLLGKPGEVAREAVTALSDALLECMRNLGRKFVSVDVLRRLEADLPSMSILQEAEEATRIATERLAQLVHLDPVLLASKEVNARIASCVAACQLLLPVESLAPWDLQPIVDTVDGLVEEGHLYRCRHVVARLMALIGRCSDVALKARVFAFCVLAATDQAFTEGQRILFAEACYRVADSSQWWNSGSPDDIFPSLGFKRPS